jgi:hypothetical protein
MRIGFEETGSQMTNVVLILSDRRRADAAGGCARPVRPHPRWCPDNAKALRNLRKKRVPVGFAIPVGWGDAGGTDCFGNRSQPLVPSQAFEAAAGAKIRFDSQACRMLVE